MGTRISIEDMKAGAFVGAPVLKPVEFEKDGELCEVDVYVRSLGYLSAVYEGTVHHEKDFDAWAASRIASCIVDEKGIPIFASVDQIMGRGEYAAVGPLSESLTLALFAVVQEVNPQKKSNSTTPTNSGANSLPAELVEELSEKPSKT